mmetsp:Transcript_11704/g.22264  ORF Transcript_11704/g.22264 Transcript_11704/m.22264 type:complete len:339 (-) Transcript_11704:278-1294(-)
MNFQRLSPLVVSVLGMNPGKHTLAGTNTYLIGTGPKRILLDTGEGKKEYTQNLVEALKANNITGIQEILVTHWHHDHVGGISSILSLFPDQTIPVSKLTKIPDSIRKTPVPCTVEDVEYNEIKDSMVFTTPGATLQAVYTPGHTDDHVSFFLQEENSIFSGDCILGVGTTIFTDLYLYMKSLETLKGFNPERIYPGHGPIIDDGAKRIETYISHRNKRENQIVEALQTFQPNSASCMDIVLSVYTEISKTLHTSAAGNVLHHLRKLQAEDRVELVTPEQKIEGQSTASHKPSTEDAETKDQAPTEKMITEWQWRLIQSSNPDCDHDVANSNSESGSRL